MRAAVAAVVSLLRVIVVVSGQTFYMRDTTLKSSTLRKKNVIMRKWRVSSCHNFFVCFVLVLMYEKMVVWMWLLTVE
jgi:hypothetical protein